MKQPLVVVVQDKNQMSCSERFKFNFILGLKIAALVLLTYGLMIAMFKLCLVFETLKGTIPEGYMVGGGIILGLFVANVIFWGVLWCWGARIRDQLRKDVVERQLAIIREEERIQEEKDLQEQKMMIQQKRRQGR